MIVGVEGGVYGWWLFFLMYWPRLVVSFTVGEWVGGSILYGKAVPKASMMFRSLWRVVLVALLLGTCIWGGLAV